MPASPTVAITTAAASSSAGSAAGVPRSGVNAQLRRWTASAASRRDDRAVGDAAHHVAIAHVRELVGDDDPHLVAAVAIQQRVEQHDPLGQTESGHVGVGSGRTPARVDRVDLADLDVRDPRQLEHIRARLALGQRREVVEHRVQQHRSETRHRRPDEHRATRRRQPPMARIAARGGDHGTPAGAGERGLDAGRLEQVCSPAAPGLGHQADRLRAPAREHRQRQRRPRQRDRQTGAGDDARRNRPFARASKGTRRTPDQQRERTQIDGRASERERELRPRERRSAADLLGAEVRLETDRRGLDRRLARSQDAAPRVRRGDR